MKINIETIPNIQQKYPTVGDYWIDADGTIQFRISELGDENQEIMVFVHELIEFALVKARGIKIEDIDAFDIQFERERERGMHDDDEEPGFDPFSPYFKEHAFATKIERMLGRELNVDWSEYDKKINEL